MEGWFQDAVAKISKLNTNKNASSYSSSYLDSPLNPPPLSSSSSSISTALVSRPPRQWVSLWTCSKLCAVCFVAGVFVGYTLKRRVRRWVSSFLRRLKDD